MSYGPQRKKSSDIFPIPKWYKCNHTHVSGRSCTRTVIKSGTSCDLCQPIYQTSSLCEECVRMLQAFGMRPG